MNVSLPPIQATTLTQRVAQRLHDAIVQGVLPPGTRISETALAASLNVSRSPVHDALIHLEDEGLIVRTREHGITIWRPTEQDVKEILSLRVAIEVLAAERVIGQLREEDFDRLGQLIAQQKEAISQGDHLALTRHDRAFHDYFLWKSEHERLQRMWHRCMSQWEVLMFCRVRARPVISESVIEDHSRLLSAYRKQDLEQVARLHRDINARVGAELTEILRSNPNASRQPEGAISP
ncbi:MAG: GntR family transcriptional regulator [Anaerolineae bacterium]